MEVACANALSKARAVAAQRPGTILGVDTIVALDGEIFGKPSCANDALSTLKRLSGRTHEVVSGLALLSPSNPQVVHEVTKVTFRTSARSCCNATCRAANGPKERAVMRFRAKVRALVRAISGNYLNVVGLPVTALLDLDLSLILRED